MNRIDGFIHHVRPIWYLIYWGWMFVYSIILIALAVIDQLDPGADRFNQILALNGTTVTLATVHALFSISLFWVIKHFSWPLATLASAMFFSLTLLNGMGQTDPSVIGLIFVAAWSLMAFMNGQFGVPMIVLSVFFTGSYVVLHYEFRILEASIVTMVLFVSDVALAGLGYLFWKRRWINVQAEQINALSDLLRSSQEQSFVLIQSVIDGVIVIDTDGNVQLINESAATMLGRKIQDVSGQNINAISTILTENGEEFKQDLFSKVLKHGVHVSKNAQIVAHDTAQTKIVSLIVSPVKPTDNKIIGAVAILRDINEEYLAQQQRSEFLMTASHEMRTPIATIEGYLGLALNPNVSTIDDKVRDYIKHAYDANQHLGDLFHDLLTSSQLDNNRLELHFETVRASNIVKRLCDDLQFSARNKGLNLNLNIDTIAEDTQISADPSRIHEALSDLVENAVKYTPSGGVSVGLGVKNNNAVITISDTGVGIAEKDLPKLFEKFSRLDNSTTRDVGGTGLGLYICGNIIKAHHGDIKVESTLGRGTTFTVDLPLIK